jgi:hypothetical protein
MRVVRTQIDRSVVFIVFVKRDSDIFGKEHIYFGILSEL